MYEKPSVRSTTSRGTEPIRRDFDLIEILQNLLSRWYLIVTVTLLATLLGGIYNYLPYFSPDRYSASTLIYIGNRVDEDTKISTSTLSVSSALLKDYTQLIQSRLVTQGVCERLGIPSLGGYGISVTGIEDTRFIRITVSGPYPDSCAHIANAIAEEFAATVVDLMNIRNVSVIDQAVVPSGPSGPPRLRNTVIIGALAFSITVLGLIVIDLANNTIKTPDDIESHLDIPVLALVSVVETDKK